MKSDSSTFNVNAYPLKKSKVVAIATDKYLTPVVSFPDQRYLPHNNIPKFGQDISYAYRKNSPKNYSVGDNIDELKKKTTNLLKIFADGDSSGMAKRLFHEFLLKQPHVKFFSDVALNNIASTHPNIKSFCNLLFQHQTHQINQ